ncbi:MAG: DinB family protein [Sphaerobacteraceae bacterium]|nr:MAG: DinB family protein [Sphaerobacteraceae bacterium]
MTEKAQQHEPGTHDRHQALLEELESTRRLYMELVALTSDANWHSTSGNPAWTVGQVMGHIVMVFDAIPWKMERLRKGKGAPGLPAFLFNPLNVLSTRLATRKYSPENIAAAYEEAHTKALGTLSGIQEHEWHLAATFFGEHQDTAELFHYHAKHVREHEPDVRAGV